jgi:hypothetical protein
MPQCMRLDTGYPGGGSQLPATESRDVTRIALVLTATL